jgi:putative radical SAM enzyme (TIGR03279 family)
MAQVISGVEPGSPADRAGICPGDELLTINGETVIDFIDYQALTASATLDIRTRRGHFGVHKDPYEDLGLEFDRPMMSGVRMCANKCLFCFVDQLPACARKSLRVKDDDWRMSLMMGNYVTLTNVSDRELDRIVRRHVSPLYISVHAMNPALRARILGTDRGAKLPEQMKKLAAGGTQMHCQAVLCPGLNDADELERTIAELADMYPAVQSLALVPVGLTGHRDGLAEMRKYRKDEARAVIAIADRWRRACLEKFGTRFVFPSDEFYLAAEMEVPADEEYEDYSQIDDGVGMLRLLATEYGDAWSAMDRPEPKRKCRPLIACGVSAAPFFETLMARYPVPGADVRVTAVKNRFFGEEVTVSGLITGGDLVRQVKDIDCTHVLITCTMLRDGENVFLDDMTLEEAVRLIGRPVIPVGRQGGDLLQAIIDIVEGKNG